MTFVKIVVSLCEIFINMENSDNSLSFVYECGITPSNTKLNTKSPSVSRSFTYEDIKKAFMAGQELVNEQWHMAEFHVSNCNCNPISYNNFDEWLNQNYTQKIKA